MRSNSKEEGGILVLVLLVVALVLSIGVQAVDRLHLTFNQAVKTLKDDQSYWYALGLESTASNLLTRHKEEKDFFKPLILDSNVPLIRFNLNETVIEGSLKDLSSCFNLNSLVQLDNKGSMLVANNQGLVLYRNLLSSLEIDSFKIENLIYGLLDWIDSDDSLINNYGAEDDFYTRKDNPYLTANQLLSNESELANIKNYNNNILKKILPYVCVLPKPGLSRMNINAISIDKPEILMMLFGQGLTRESALQVLGDRPSEGYLVIDDFLSHSALKGLVDSRLVKSYLALDSSYYLLNSKIISKDHSFVMNSSLELLGSGDVQVFKRELMF